MALFAGMVLTGALTLGLITSAIASLLVPENQIGLRPYLVSSLPAVLMLFLAIVPALWCYWFWRQLFPPVKQPKRRAMARRRPKSPGAAATRAVVPKAKPRPRPTDPSVTERATADLLKRREERREQTERRRLEERRREEATRRAEHQHRLEERRRAEEERVRAAEERRRTLEERQRAVEERRAERRRLAEERRQLEEERRRAGEPVAMRPPPPVAARPATPAKATPLAELRLSERVHRTLSQGGIETIEQLTSRTQAEVLELNGIGAKSLEDILAALDRAGRALRYPQRVSTIS